VFFEMHSHIRDIDGLHADEALDEVCKILYAKLYDEEAASPTGRPRAHRWLYGLQEEFAATIRSLYDQANEYDTRVFGLKIPGYQRSRGVFNTPIRLSSPALTKAVESLQDYSLTDSSTDVKGRAFQKVLGPTIRAGMGQYFTPDPITRFAVEVVSPTANDLILDPFCGSAHFLTRCLEFVRRATPRVPQKVLQEFAFGKLHGVEKSDRMVRVAMTDMRLQGDGHSNIRCTDALLSFQNYPDLIPESFDIVLTNPPFGSLLGTEALSQLGDFDLARGRKTVPLEILGLERCIQFLRPGGRLAIVVPDGVLANRNSRYVREWLQSQTKLRAIVSLPIETFSPFGANIKTSIVFVRKWRSGEHRERSYPVFMQRIDNVGYDATARHIDGCELDNAAAEATKFIAREGW
jgi:type I restriction enzyme M protein